MAEVAAKEVAALNEVAEVEAMPKEGGGGAGSGGQQRGSSQGGGGGGFGGGLSSGKSAGDSQRSNAGAETFRWWCRRI